MDDVVDKEFVPLEGEEDGEGNFLGSICSQYSLGNLVPSDRKRRASRVKIKYLYLQDPSMMTTTNDTALAQLLKRVALEGLWQQTSLLDEGR